MSQQDDWKFRMALDIAEQKRRRRRTILIVVLVAMFVPVVLINVFSDKTAARLQAPKAPDKVDAWINARNFVERNLKEAKTAEFPYIDEARIVSRGGNVWEVWSYVDAQNSFGARIRTTFYVEIEYVPSADQWKLLTIEM